MRPKAARQRAVHGCRGCAGPHTTMREAGGPYFTYDTAAELSVFGTSYEEGPEPGLGMVGTAERATLNAFIRRDQCYGRRGGRDVRPGTRLG